MMFSTVCRYYASMHPGKQQDERRNYILQQIKGCTFQFKEKDILLYPNVKVQQISRLIYQRKSEILKQNFA